MTSLQFPVRTRPRINRSVGTLYYQATPDHAPIAKMVAQPFWKLEQKKKELICEGYKKEGFSKHYAR